MPPPWFVKVPSTTAQESKTTLSDTLPVESLTVPFMSQQESQEKEDAPTMDSAA